MMVKTPFEKRLKNAERILIGAGFNQYSGIGMARPQEQEEREHIYGVFQRASHAVAQELGAQYALGFKEGAKSRGYLHRPDKP